MSPEEIKKILEEHKLWLDSNGRKGEMADFGGAELKKANLKGANLKSSNFEGAYLYQADLSGANLEKADFGEADMEYAELEDANLEKINLYGAQLYGVNFDRANLRYANLKETFLEHATLKNANLEKADLEGAYIYEAELQGADLRKANLKSANFEGANLEGANMSEANLEGANFLGANLEYVDLRNATIIYTNLDDINFKETNLESITIDETLINKIPNSLKKKYGSTFLILGWRDVKENENIILRSIEFPPEYHQAGISILNYFGSVLRKKYPEQNAKITIEQIGLKVIMTVDPLEGDREIIEKALDEYGLVVTGRKSLQEYTDDKLLKIDLENKLLLAKTEIEMQNKLLSYQNSEIAKRDLQIDRLLSSIGHAVQNPAKYEIHIPVSSHSVASITQEINITQQTSLIHGSLSELLEQLQTGSKEAKMVQELQDSLEQIDKGTPPEEVARSSAMSKFRRFLANVEKAETIAGKIINTTKDGIDIARRLAGYYNEIAQWCGLPQVPKPFIKKPNF